MSEAHTTTELLKRAFAEASRLPEEEQVALAEWLMEELKSEQCWQRALSRSQERLTELAAEARTEHREGRTVELNPETLRGSSR